MEESSTSSEAALELQNMLPQSLANYRTIQYGGHNIPRAGGIYYAGNNPGTRVDEDRSLIDG